MVFTSKYVLEMAIHQFGACALQRVVVSRNVHISRYLVVKGYGP